MKHEFFFYAGLPRSGGTMLASLMNQHPDLYCSSLSPTVELLVYNQKYFVEESEQFKADSNIEGMNNVLRGIPQNYYAHIPKKYIMDNNRAWPNNIDRIKQHITDKPKIVCIVRDVAGILASFIHLLNKNNNQGKNFVDRWLLQNGLPLTTEARCYYLMQPIGIVNQSLWSFAQAFEKNQSRYLHIVEYEDLISNPQETMSNITKFLEIDNFNFDFENIINVTPVDDTTYNLEGMHDVRKKLEHNKLDPRKILGDELIAKYSGLEFWRKNKYNIFI